MLSKNHLQMTVILSAGLLIGILIPAMFLSSEIRDLNQRLTAMSSIVESQNTTIAALREEVALLENCTEEGRPWWLYYGDVSPG